jgi:hypothetical protein
VKIFSSIFFKEQKKTPEKSERKAVLYDIKDLIPQERKERSDVDVENLVGQLRQLCGCLLIQSSRFVNPNDTIQILNVSEFQSWLEKCSEELICGLSLFSHCCRLETWLYLAYIIPELCRIEICGNNMHLIQLIEQSQEFEAAQTFVNLSLKFSLALLDL